MGYQLSIDRNRVKDAISRLHGGDDVILDYHVDYFVEGPSGILPTHRLIWSLSAFSLIIQEAASSRDTCCSLLITFHDVENFNLPATFEGLSGALKDLHESDYAPPLLLFHREHNWSWLAPGCELISHKTLPADLMLGTLRGQFLKNCVNCSVQEVLCHKKSRVVSFWYRFDPSHDRNRIGE